MSAGCLKPFSFLNFLANPIISIPNEHIRPILNILERLEMLYKNMKKADLPLIRWYLLSLMTEVNRFVEYDKKTSIGEALDKDLAMLRGTFTSGVF